ncbi:MAG: hypothetical protein ACLR1T_03605 [Evtepia gabavorous]
MLTQEVELVVLYDTEGGPGVCPPKSDGAASPVRPERREGGVLHGASPGTHRCAGGRGSGGFLPLAFRWMVLEKEEAPVIGRVTLGEKRGSAPGSPL